MAHHDFHSETTTVRDTREYEAEEERAMEIERLRLKQEQIKRNALTMNTPARSAKKKHFEEAVRQEHELAQHLVEEMHHDQVDHHQIEIHRRNDRSRSRSNSPPKHHSPKRDHSPPKKDEKFEMQKKMREGAKKRFNEEHEKFSATYEVDVVHAIDRGHDIENLPGVRHHDVYNYHQVEINRENNKAVNETFKHIMEDKKKRDAAEAELYAKIIDAEFNSYQTDTKASHETRSQECRHHQAFNENHYHEVLEKEKESFNNWHGKHDDYVEKDGKLILKDVKQHIANQFQKDKSSVEKHHVEIDHHKNEDMHHASLGHTKTGKLHISDSQVMMKPVEPKACVDCIIF